MEAGSSTIEWDILVAAVLTVPVIEPGASAKDRIQQYLETLQELRRQGRAGNAPNPTGM